MRNGNVRMPSAPSTYTSVYVSTSPSWRNSTSQEKVKSLRGGTVIGKSFACFVPKQESGPQPPAKPRIRIGWSLLLLTGKSSWT